MKPWLTRDKEWVNHPDAQNPLQLCPIVAGGKQPLHHSHAVTAHNLSYMLLPEYF